MKFVFSLVLALLFISQISAGNGVERGRVILNHSNEMSPEISKFIEKQLGKCVVGAKTNIFNVQKVEERTDRIDQGIIDVYYNLQLSQKTETGKLINELEIEVLDSDFDNWRHYEEKLSLDIKSDMNKKCLTK